MPYVFDASTSAELQKLVPPLVPAAVGLTIKLELMFEGGEFVVTVDAT
jgi:hypothetical protein